MEGAERYLAGSFSQTGHDAEWLVYQLKGREDIGDHEIGGHQGFGGGPLCRHHADTHGCRLQHKGIIRALTDGYNGVSSQAFHERSFLRLFIPGRKPSGGQIQLLVDGGLASVGVSRQQVDVQPIPKRGYPLGQSFDKHPVDRKSAVDVCNEMFQADLRASGNREFDHSCNYTVESG